jgi:hypothetical protein
MDFNAKRYVRSAARYSRRMNLITGLVIFLCTCSIFLISRVHQFADSNYSMLVSESLLHHGSFTLDHYAIPHLQPVPQNGYVTNGNIYQLELFDGHIYYAFPPGSSILSVPYVAIMNAFGVSASNADGTYNPQGEAKIEASLAALLMAALATLIFYASRLLLPLGWSVLIALSGAFATQIWSTASRALWSDTWGIFLLGFVVWMLLAQETNRGRIRPVLLGSLLSWSYFVRPTSVLPVAAITIYLFIFYRSLFARYAATGALWFVGFVVYSWHHFDQVLPNYYQASRLSFNTFWIALAGNLISPSRGLLVFVPVIAFVGYLLVRYAKELRSPRLVVLCLSIIVAHLIVISGFSPWWGGHCFGPRYTTGLVPWFSLLGILAVTARLAWVEKNALLGKRATRSLELAVGGMLLVCSFLINARGATAQSTWFWNVQPVNVDEHSERVWDWKRPQFLAR